MTNPTPADWRELCAELLDALESTSAADMDDWPNLRARARAALAQPEPQMETVAWCSSDDFNDAAKKRQSFSGWREQHPDCDLALCVFPVTAQPEPQGPTGRPAIEPVPVAERLPGPEDCDESGLTCNGGGWCWWFEQSSQMWVADFYSSHYTHWLPHHALPVPQLEGNHG